MDTLALDLWHRRKGEKPKHMTGVVAWHDRVTKAPLWAEVQVNAGILDRLEAKLDKSGDCWLWAGAKNQKGYGIISLGTSEQPHPKISTHKLAWLAWRGDLPLGAWVLHKCDTPACCNPEHLFLGDAKENVRDMLRKNRTDHARMGETLRRNWAAGKYKAVPPRPEKKVFGERVRTAKLTPDMVRNIRSRRHPMTWYADLYEVSLATIYRALNGETWAHV